jgi:hypothetical protein
MVLWGLVGSVKTRVGSAGTCRMRMVPNGSVETCRVDVSDTHCVDAKMSSRKAS